jgi:uncharacterized membrane protein YccC
VLARIAGTVVGVFVVAAVVDGLNLGNVGVIVVVGLGSVIALMFIWAEYAIAVGGVTIFVIALFSLVGAPVSSTVWLRIIDTLIAGAITIAASFIWPAVKDERHPHVHA